ncbi:hypothetical protein FMM58_03345 [Campylobacter sp. LR291e]|uniref:hypothetical protein n=1 Tax=Campylobacter sp. LR291e TaxID=2593546 RepID=UPI001239683E|nr:hypothetical protein [Campylobacter sp. LR291e]KAA6231635.1 hypothetical protein FMM58_03345 [Campylobacter sp. LR291e]
MDLAIYFYNKAFLLTLCLVYIPLYLIYYKSLKYKIYFYNDCIILRNDNLQVKINLNDIKQITKSIDTRNEQLSIIQFAFRKYMIIVVTLIVYLFLYIGGFFSIICVLCFIFFILWKLCFHLYHGDKITDYKFFDAIIISSYNHKFINILPKNKSEYLQFKQYVETKLNKNIDKVVKNF